jgi:hypothetical protein
LRQNLVAPAGAIEKCDTNMVFELPQSYADGGLRSRYTLRRFLDAAFFDHGYEHFKLHQFHVSRSSDLQLDKTKGRYPFLDNGLWASRNFPAPPLSALNGHNNSHGYDDEGWHWLRKEQRSRS